MWRRKNDPKWRSFSRRMPRDKKDKNKSFIVCYECKNPRHFKCECPNLEKIQDKKKFFEPKEKKGLMSMWKDLDEDDKEANMCLMADTTSKESKSD